MMADYNGWTDEREAERKALDKLEMTPTAAAAMKRRHPAGRVRGLLVHAAVREILARSAA